MIRTENKGRTLYTKDPNVTEPEKLHGTKKSPNKTLPMTCEGEYTGSTG